MEQAEARPVKAIAVQIGLIAAAILGNPVHRGGALKIETATRTESVKGPSGSLVLYPSTELQRGAPVTSGERIVFVGWIESLIRNAGERAILFDLANLKAGLAKTETNLIRLWAS